MNLTYKVDTENLTINNILKNKLHISSRLFNKLIKNHLVTCNGIVCDTRNKVNIGDVVTVNFDYEENNSNIVAKKMDLNIVYEDEWLLILNKPRQIAVHPSILHYDDSLANGVKFYFNSIDLQKKIRPVNRLDYSTCGLIVFAKNEYIQECLIEQMASGAFKKEYLAIVTGTLQEKNGIINKPIARKEASIIERCISSNGKNAITRYEVLKEFDGMSLVKCLLETGRTHQIRVHFASIGHPLLGDSLYGEKSNLIDGQALICYKLSFIHPITKEKAKFELSQTEFLHQIPGIYNP